MASKISAHTCARSRCALPCQANVDFHMHHSTQFSNYLYKAEQYLANMVIDMPKPIPSQRMCVYFVINSGHDNMLEKTMQRIYAASIRGVWEAHDVWLLFEGRYTSC